MAPTLVTAVIAQASLRRLMSLYWSRTNCQTDVTRSMNTEANGCNPIYMYRHSQGSKARLIRDQASRCRMARTIVSVRDVIPRMESVVFTTVMTFRLTRRTKVSVFVWASKIRVCCSAVRAWLAAIAMIILSCSAR